jgi:hypothetical protein
VPSELRLAHEPCALRHGADLAHQLIEHYAVRSQESQKMILEKCMLMRLQPATEPSTPKILNLRLDHRP